MSKAKKALSKMKEVDKLAAIDMLLDSLDKPHIFACKIGDEMVKFHGSQGMRVTTFLEMMAGLLIAMADCNDVTPIKMLSGVGEAMEDLMNRREKYERTKADNS